MEVQVEQTSSYLRRFSVTLPQAKVSKAHDNAARKVGKGVSLPGFRAGKVPRAMLERNFGQQLREAIFEDLIGKTILTALDEKEIVPVSEPSFISFSPLQSDAAFTYVFEVEVVPDIALTNYKGLNTSSVADAVVTEAEIESAIAKIRRDLAEMVPATEPKPAQEGDLVLVDYTCRIGGMPVPDNAGKDAWITVGDTAYPAEFMAAIEGAEVPGQSECVITLPANAQNRGSEGTKAVYTVILKELKTPELPELNDAFAKDAGSETLAELRVLIESKYRAYKNQQAKQAQRHTLLKALVAANPFEVPPAMIDTQIQKMVTDRTEQMERQTGTKPQLDDATLAEVRGEFSAEAEFQVRAGLLIIQVARANELQISTDDVDAKIEKICAERGDDAQQVRRYYRESAQRENLKFELLEDRVIAHLLEDANVQSLPEAPEQA